MERTTIVLVCICIVFVNILNETVGHRLLRRRDRFRTGSFGRNGVILVTWSRAGVRKFCLSGRDIRYQVMGRFMGGALRRAHPSVDCKA